MAIARHPELKLILDITPPQPPPNPSWQKSSGKTAILCTDAGVGMMLWDTLAAARCAVGNCEVLREEANLSIALTQTLAQWQGQYQRVVLALSIEQGMDAMVLKAIAAAQSTLKVTLYSPGLSASELPTSLSYASSLAAVVRAVK